MDDLRQVKDFRCTEPAPSDAARAAARTALGDAISAEGAGSRPGRFRRRPRVRLLALAAAVVAVAAAVLFGVFGRGGPSAGPPKPTGPHTVLVSSKVAVKALRHLASTIAARPLTLQPGQYLYSDSESSYPTYSGSCVTYAVDHRQMWVRTDGSGLMRDTEEPEQFTSASDRARCLQADPNMQLRGAHTDNDWNAPNCLSIMPAPGFTWSDLSSDPHMLLQQLRKIEFGPNGYQPTAGVDFLDIGTFLRFTDTPPRVRAALYRAAALIPGVKLLGTVRDHHGRPGLGVSFPSQSPFVSGPHAVPGQTSVLIFDQHTGELLGEQGTRPRFWAVYQREQVVNALPENPPVPLTPPCGDHGGVVHPLPDGDYLLDGAPLTSP